MDDVSRSLTFSVIDTHVIKHSPGMAPLGKNLHVNENNLGDVAM